MLFNPRSLQVDVCVIETGLGGARDATNVFDADCLLTAVIAPIGRDHQASLGGSLHSIATAKAGILKPSAPLVLAEQPEKEAHTVLLQAAGVLGCPVFDVPALTAWTDGGMGVDPEVHGHAVCLRSYVCVPNVSVHVPMKDTHKISTLFVLYRAVCTVASTQGAVVQHATLRLRPSLTWGTHNGDQPAMQLPITMRLLGAHQIGNAATAAVAASVISKRGLPRVNVDAVVEGLSSASLLGRCQVQPVFASVCGGGHVCAM